jgi:hypothetical protein
MRGRDDEETHDPSDAGNAGEAHVALDEGRLVRETEAGRICEISNDVSISCLSTPTMETSVIEFTKKIEEKMQSSSECESDHWRTGTPRRRSLPPTSSTFSSAPN